MRGYLVVVMSVKHLSSNAAKVWVFLIYMVFITVIILASIIYHK